MRNHLRFSLVSLISFMLVVFMTGLQYIQFEDAAVETVYKAFYNLLTFVITMVLLGGWGISVVKRIIQPMVRQYLIFIDAAMLFWLFIREIKWRYISSPHVISILWYLFYIPMILIPVYSFFASRYLGREEEYRASRKWQAIYVMATILIILVLTNNIHEFVFKLDFPYAAEVGDYSYGIGYYIIVLWIVLFSSLFIITAGRRCNKNTIGWKRYIPFAFLALGLLYVYGYINQNRIKFFPDVDLVVAYAWFTIMIWETCTELGLITVNSYYLDFFKLTSIGAQITDEEGNPYISASSAIGLPKEAFANLKEQGTYQYNLGVRLHIYPVNCGYMIWQEDVATVNGMIELLMGIQEELKEGNTIAEQEMRAEVRRRKNEETNRLYTILSKNMEDELALINGLSRKLLQSTDIDEIKKLLSCINFVGVYLKRKSNFIMIAETRNTIPWEELELALQEIEKNLVLCDIQFSYKIAATRELERMEVLNLMEAIEAIVEANLFKTNAIFVKIDSGSQNTNLTIRLPGTKVIRLSFDREVGVNA